jgi:hypothetical protein
MQILSDVAQKSGRHIAKEAWWKEHDIEVITMPLPVGDYVLVNDKITDVINRKSKRGIDVKKMDFLGTYNVVVDTKQDMNEIEGNIIGKAHARFRDECILAQNNNIKLYVLIENMDGINSIQDVFRYTSPRRLKWFKFKKLHEQGKALRAVIPDKPPVSGEQLAKAMLTMQYKYGVEFRFCRPKEAGAEVIRLLTEERGESK